MFDIHAYEKWLLVSNSDVDTRLQNLITHKLPVIFCEIAPMNSGTLMNPSYFLTAIHNKSISVCAWVWKYDQTDQDALLDASGMPNNTNNNNWGTTFKNLATSPRNP